MATTAEISGASMGVEEQYARAASATDLTLRDHSSGAADLLIAAGLSGEAVGADLARLLSEWDSAAKPKMPNEAILRTMAAHLKEDDAKAKERAIRDGIPYRQPSSPVVRAHAEGRAWYARELRLLAQGLKTRAVCVEHVRKWCLVKGLDADYAGAALYHWLSPKCVICHGLGNIKAPDAPVATKTCHACGGTGETLLNDTAFRVKDWLNGCFGRVRAGIVGNREAVRAAKRFINHR